MKKLLYWTLPVTAVLMLVLMLIPAEVWNHPVNDVVYQGFDLNLMYIGDRGITEVTPECLKLTALPDSQPVVHLITTPLKRLRVSLDVRILKMHACQASIPLRISIWSARTTSGCFLDFGAPPENLIKTQTVVEGVVTQTLAVGKVIRNETLGNYEPDKLYHLEMTLDKEKGLIETTITGREAPPTGNPMLRLADSDKAAYGDVISVPIPVEEGEEYSFGGLVKLLSGADSYKIDIEWLNKSQQHLGFVGNWRSIQDLNGWTWKEFKTIAPQEAAFARVFLGIHGRNDQLLFSDLFLNEGGSSINLLPNGDFSKGTEGWAQVNQQNGTFEIISPHPVFLNSSITVAEAPDLFNSLRLSLTLSALSHTDMAVATVGNYTLFLPHQRWQVVEVDDVRAKVLVVALNVLGVLLIMKKTSSWVRENVRLVIFRLRTVNRPITLPSTSFVMRVGLVLAFFFVFNAFLFNLGSLPFDMMAEKIWAYSATKYGPLELYHLPNIVGLAKVWGGTPYQEAVFPYNFGFTYVFTVIGWIYKLFLNAPGPLVMDTFMLEFVIKSFNLFSIFVDGVLIYLILKEMKVVRKQSILASCLFLFNPAVWFISSIWGQTYLISLFFMLAAIWLAEKQHIQWAWLTLAVGILNRPQMLIPMFLLSLSFLRKFSIRDNLQSILWSIITVFLLLAPFSLAISPSTPVDIFTNQLFIQEAGGNDPALTLVSLDAYNLWPLITYTKGARGLERIHYPSPTPLAGQLSYQQISQILTIAIILVAAILILLRPDYVFFLTLGTVGFLVLKTGLAATHFVFALPLLILCRKSMGNFAWHALIAIWTATMLTSIYGIFGYSIENVGYLAPAIHSSNNIVTRFFMQLYPADWCITLGSAANLGVLAWLVVKAAQPLWSLRRY